MLRHFVPVIAALVATVCVGQETRYRIGIELAQPSVTIAKVSPESPAADAGFLPGDVVVSIDGRKITEIDTLISTVSGYTGDNPLRFVVRRGDAEVNLAVTPVQDAVTGGTESTDRGAEEDRLLEFLDALFQQRRYLEAEVVASQLIRVNEFESEYQLLRLKSLIFGRGKNDFSIVEAEARELAQRFLADDYALGGLHEVLVDDRDPMDERLVRLSREAMQKAIDFDESNTAMPHLYLADTYAILDDLDKAIEVLEHALTLGFEGDERLLLEAEIDSLTMSQSDSPSQSSVDPPGVRHQNDESLLQNADDQVVSMIENDELVSGETWLAGATNESMKDIVLAPENNRPVPMADLYADAGDGVLVMVMVDASGDKPECYAVASGFLISTDGLCVSNHHVFHDDTDPIVAMTRDGKLHRITEMIASDRRHDLALFRIEDSDEKGTGFRALPMRPKAPVGTPVCVLSHPDGQLYTLSEGILSRRFQRRLGLRADRFIDLLSITADFGVGSSGAPILDDRGNAVAVVTETMAVLADDTNRSDSLQMVVKICMPIEHVLALINPDS